MATPASTTRIIYLKDTELDVTGYDRLIFIDPVNSNAVTNDSAWVQVDFESLNLSILRNNEDSIHIDLRPVMSDLKQFGQFSQDTPVDRMTVAGGAEGFSYKIYFRALGFDEEDGAIDLSFIEFYLLFKEEN